MAKGSAKTSSGFMIQSEHGIKGNFELVFPSQLGGMVSCWRNNDAPGLPWSGLTAFGSGLVGGVSLIQSNFGTPGLGHLEVAARLGDQLALFWREDEWPYDWTGPAYFGSGAVANPALIQTRFGTKGNFEVVAPLATGGIGHWWRNNDSPALPWSGPAVFGTGLGKIEGVGFLQSNFGTPGNLEVIATIVSGPTRKLAHFSRQSAAPFAWSGPIFLPDPPGGGGPQGVPGFIQSRHGSKDNFEVVVGLSTGGLAHFWRDNDNPALPWIATGTFGQGDVTAVSLMQSSFGTPGLGSLELAARAGAQTMTYWRNDKTFAWSASGAACDETMCNPSTQGEWRVPYAPTVVGIHGAVLRTGKVLLFAYKEGAESVGVCSVLDLATGAETTPTIPTNPFCGGQNHLPDGRVLTSGGHASGASLTAMLTFTPSGDGGSWQQVATMPQGRWYPTLTALPDGQVFILSGTVNGGPEGPGNPVNASYALFHPAAGLQPPQPAPVLNEMSPFAVYPFVFVLPDGRLLIHGNNFSVFFDLASMSFQPGKLQAVRAEPRTYNVQGTAVLLPLLPNASPAYRARAMIIGGGGLPAAPETPATNTCEILDLGAGSPSWQPAASMAHPRVMVDAVLLPDGTVLATNGSSAGKADAGTAPVYPAELYNPATNTWTTVCSARVPRLYHSIAMLLPDGRVLTAGTDGQFNPHGVGPEFRAEAYSPPYLFKGPRPQLTSAPQEVSYGANFQVQSPNAASVQSAAFIRPGAVTHSFNHAQRYVGLTITAKAGGAVTLKAPPNPNVAPPGYHMLFILNGEGVPSSALFVQLK